MKHEQLRQLMAGLAEQAVPNDPDLWSAVRARLEQPRSRDHQAPCRRTGRGSRRLAIRNTLSRPLAVLVACLLVAVLAGTGYAGMPLTDEHLGSSPATLPILQLGKPLHLVQTVQGYTVTLERAYAQSDFVFVGYTISTPPGTLFNNLSPHSTTLSDNQGRELPLRAQWAYGVQGGAEAMMATYRRTDQESEQKSIRLWYTIQSIDTDTTTGAAEMAHGSFAFDFTVPIVPDRAAVPNKTVSSGGWSVTLERILVTPTGTLATLRGVGPDADIELNAGGRTYRLYQPGGTYGRDAKRCFAQHDRCPTLWRNLEIDYLAAAMKPAGADGRGLIEDTGETALWIQRLAQTHGEWTLVVKPDPSRANPIFELPGGPWVFHVTVP